MPIVVSAQSVVGATDWSSVAQLAVVGIVEDEW